MNYTPKVRQYGILEITLGCFYAEGNGLAASIYLGEGIQALHTERRGLLIEKNVESHSLQKDRRRFNS